VAATVAFWVQTQWREESSSPGDNPLALTETENPLPNTLRLLKQKQPRTNAKCQSQCVFDLQQKQPRTNANGQSQCVCDLQQKQPRTNAKGQCVCDLQLRQPRTNAQMPKANASPTFCDQLPAPCSVLHGIQLLTVSWNLDPVATGGASDCGRGAVRCVTKEGGALDGYEDVGAGPITYKVVRGG
jgi:hypothetical protein